MTSRGIVMGILAAAPIWMVVAAAQVVIPGVETGDWSATMAFLPAAAVAAAATAIVLVMVHRKWRVFEASTGRAPHHTVYDGVQTVCQPKADTQLGWFVSVQTVTVVAAAIILGVYQLPDAEVTTRIALAGAVALMLAPSILVLVQAPRIITPVYRLTVDAEGVQLRGRRLSISIPWHDIASWRVGVPAGLLNSLFQCDVVLASPADHVRDPRAGDRRALWSRRDHQWLLCEPALMDGRDGEIAAAFQLFARRKHAVEGAGKGPVDP